MTNKKLENQIAHLQHARLSDDERSTLRTSLTEHIHQKGKTASPYVFRSWFSYKQPAFALVTRTFVITLFILGAVGGTMSFAAAHALPGEILYGIKLSNEQFKERLAFSLEKKAELQRTHVENRLREASTLFQSASLEDEQREIVEEKLDKKIDELSETINSMQEAHNVRAVIEITSELEPTFGAHKKVLSVLAQDDETKASSLLSRLESGIAHMQSETKDVIESYDGNIEEIEALTKNHLEKADITLSTMLLVLEGKDLFTITENIDLAKAVQAEYDLKEAEIAYEEGAYKHALVLAQSAHTAAKEIISKLKLETDLHLTENNEDMQTLGEEYEELNTLLEELNGIVADEQEAEEETEAEAGAQKKDGDQTTQEEDDTSSEQDEEDTSSEEQSSETDSRSDQEPTAQ